MVAQKNVKTMVLLKYLSNFWRTFELSLTDCEINSILIWSADCIIIDAPANNEVPTFALTDTKLYVLVVTLSTQNNAKLLQQLKSSFKRTINWNRYQSKASIQERNQYLDFLIDSSFRGVNKHFVFSFENNDGWTSQARYYLPAVEIKNYNIMINGRNFLISQ